jgi:acetamidase/formamidase
VIFTCLEACDGQITPDSALEDLQTLDWGRIHALTGPVAVAGAEMPHSIFVS